jgi:hypothetical protein
MLKLIFILIFSSNYAFAQVPDELSHDDLTDEQELTYLSKLLDQSTQIIEQKQHQDLQADPINYDSDQFQDFNPHTYVYAISAKVGLGSTNLLKFDSEMRLEFHLRRIKRVVNP